MAILDTVTADIDCIVAEEAAIRQPERKEDGGVAEARAALARLLQDGLPEPEHRTSLHAQRLEFQQRVEYYHLKLEAALRGLNPTKYERDLSFDAATTDNEQQEGMTIVTPGYVIEKGTAVMPTDKEGKPKKRIVWRRKEELTPEQKRMRWVSDNIERILGELRDTRRGPLPKRS